MRLIKRRIERKKMKNKILKFLVFLIVSTFLLSIAYIPGTFALTPTSELTPQERTRLTIENGLADWMHAKDLPTTSATATRNAFSQFISENPTYQTYMVQYANMTRPVISQVLPDQPSLTAVTVDPPFKVTNVTIGNHIYQVSQSNARTADGKTFVKTDIGCGGKDPDIYVAIEPQTINLFGFNIQYGEDDVMGIRYTPAAAQDFKFDFDQKMDDATTFTLAVIGVAALAFVFSGGSSGPISAGLAFASTIENRELTYMKNTIDGSITTDNNTELCIENYWVYPSLLSIGIFNDFKIWVRHWYSDHDEFIQAFPHYTLGWNSMMLGLTSVIIAYEISKLYYAVGNYLGYNWWAPVSVTYPLGPFPPTTSDVLSKGVRSYDQSSNLIDANVCIDGVSLGSNPNVNITPETHTITVNSVIPTGGGYGYTLNYMTIEGNSYSNNEVTTSLSTSSDIDVHYTWGLLQCSVHMLLYCWGGLYYDYYVYYDGNTYQTIDAPYIGGVSPVAPSYVDGNQVWDTSVTLWCGGGESHTLEFQYW
jgi:hypothetical protein